MTDRATTFAAVYALLRTSADLGDHVIQTDGQATTKGQHDGVDGGSTRTGRRACTAHVATYTATQAAALAAGNRLLGLRLRPGRVALALALSAGTHWIVDRRVHLQRFAEATGKGNFYRLGGPLGGAYRIDQCAHHVAETLAAAIAASGAGR